MNIPRSGYTAFPKRQRIAKIRRTVDGMLILTFQRGQDAIDFLTIPYTPEAEVNLKQQVQALQGIRLIHSFEIVETADDPRYRLVQDIGGLEGIARGIEKEVETTPFPAKKMALTRKLIQIEEKKTALKQKLSALNSKAESKSNCHSISST